MDVVPRVTSLKKAASEAVQLPMLLISLVEHRLLTVQDIALRVQHVIQSLHLLLVLLFPPTHQQLASSLCIPARDASNLSTCHPLLHHSFSALRTHLFNSFARSTLQFAVSTCLNEMSCLVTQVQMVAPVTLQPYCICPHVVSSLQC